MFLASNLTGAKEEPTEPVVGLKEPPSPVSPESSQESLALEYGRQRKKSPSFTRDDREPLKRKAQDWKPRGQMTDD